MNNREVYPLTYKNALARDLNFDRTSVHLQGRFLAPQVAEAAKLLDSIGKEGLTADDVELCEKVSTYYLFYARDEAKAVKYLSLLKNFYPEGSNHYGIICNELGHAHTIDGDYKLTDLFNEALRFSLNPIDQAFAKRYIALIHHRHNHPDLALNLLQQVAAELTPLKSDLRALIDLAETEHLIGVVKLRQGKLNEAEIALSEALALEKEFAQKSGGLHFMQMITMQSLASLKTRQGQQDQAVILLKECFSLQESYYNTRENADIAKTYHFLGDAYLKATNYFAAETSYAQALAIKNKLFQPHNNIVKVTEEALMITRLKKLNELFDFDWNNYKTFQKNAALAPEVESFLTSLVVDEKFSEDAKQSLGELSYKLATFYNHIKREPDNALRHLKVAEKYSTDDAKAWVYNHIAYSYQQKMAQTSDNKLRSDYFLNARQYYNTIIDDYLDVSHTDIEKVKLFAFTFCVKGLSEYTAKDIKGGELSYRFALERYEDIKNYDDQHARAKLRYATILAEQGLELAAKLQFEELAKYWNSRRQQTDNPFLVRFYQTYHEFMLTHYPKEAETLSLLAAQTEKTANRFIDVSSQLQRPLQTNPIENLLRSKTSLFTPSAEENKTEVTIELPQTIRPQ